MNLTMVAALISAALAASIGWGTAWHIQAGRITEMQMEAQNERINIQRAARANLERASQQITQAQDDAQARSVVIRRDADSAASAGNGLRITSTDTVRAATADPTTHSAVIAAYDNIFTSCVSALQSVARDADQCVSERQALIQAWPR